MMQRIAFFALLIAVGLPSCVQAQQPAFDGGKAYEHLRQMVNIGPRPAGMTLDRADNDRPYEPGNVRWATPIENSRNTRRNRVITALGQSLCVTEWARKSGLNIQTILTRLRKGWPLDEAVSAPATGAKRLYLFRRNNQHTNPGIRS